VGLLLVTALVLTGATIVVHGVVTTFWLRFLVNRYVNPAGHMAPHLRMPLIIVTVCVLVCLHFVEILLWAGTYLLVAGAEIASSEAAIYFSAVTFTTLGYGDITLSSEWRLLSGFEAINGILLIGWSTAFVFAVLQRTWTGFAERNDEEKTYE
jgi:hypothetical protein